MTVVVGYTDIATGDVILAADKNAISGSPEEFVDPVPVCKLRTYAEANMSVAYLGSLIVPDIIKDGDLTSKLSLLDKLDYIHATINRDGLLDKDTHVAVLDHSTRMFYIVTKDGYAKLASSFCLGLMGARGIRLPFIIKLLNPEDDAMSIVSKVFRHCSNVTGLISDDFDNVALKGALS